MASKQNRIPVLIQKEPPKKKKSYVWPGGCLKIIEIILCIIALIITEIGRWQKIITILLYKNSPKREYLGTRQYWGELPFGFYHAHIFVLCILGTLACTTLIVLMLFLCGVQKCCGRKGLHWWLGFDFVYCIAASCLMFIAFCLLAVFSAYPEIWRPHLYGNMSWRDVYNYVIVAAAIFAFVLLWLFIISSIIAGRILNKEMKSSSKRRGKRARIIMVPQSAIATDPL